MSKDRLNDSSLDQQRKNISYLKIMKPKQLNLQFMKEANHGRAITKMHQMSPQNYDKSKQKDSFHMTLKNYSSGIRSPLNTNYSKGYVFPSTQSTVPSSLMIPSFQQTQAQYLLRHQNDNNKSQTSFIISYKQHLKLPIQALRQSKNEDQFQYLNDELAEIKQRSQSCLQDSIIQYGEQQQQQQQNDQQKGNIYHGKIKSGMTSLVTNPKLNLPNIKGTHLTVAEQSFIGSKSLVSSVRGLGGHQNPFNQQQKSSFQRNLPETNQKVIVKTMHIHPKMRTALRNFSPSSLALSSESFQNDSYETKFKPKEAANEQEKLITDFQKEKLHYFTNQHTIEEQTLQQEQQQDSVDLSKVPSLDMLTLNYNQSKDILNTMTYFSPSNFRRSISPQRDENEDILEKNNQRKSASILSNLYRIDDRAIKFKQAKNELLKITNDYLSRHFLKQTNSRDLLQSIQEQQWHKKKVVTVKKKQHDGYESQKLRLKEYQQQQ